MFRLRACSWKAFHMQKCAIIWDRGAFGKARGEAEAQWGQRERAGSPAAVGEFFFFLSALECGKGKGDTPGREWLMGR